jgi:hypothetical protein
MQRTGLRNRTKARELITSHISCVKKILLMLIDSRIARSGFELGCVIFKKLSFVRIFDFCCLFEVNNRNEFFMVVIWT